MLELYRTLAETAPPELTLVALLRPAPPAPWLPKEIHGKPIVAILGCYSGKPEDGEKLVQPLKSFGKPVGDVLVVQHPHAKQRHLARIHLAVDGDALHQSEKTVDRLVELPTACETVVRTEVRMHGYFSFDRLHHQDAGQM